MTAGRIKAAVREADWLDGTRARLYSRGLALVVGIEAVNLITRLILGAVHDPQFRPVVDDFNAFWSASWLALHGQAASAYLEAPIRAAERLCVQPTGVQYLPFLYPPTFLLLCLPLALLPYLAAMAAFGAGGYLAVMACFKRMVPGWPWLPLLAFPAAMLNAVIGQTGFLPALCFGGAALLLEARPLLGGACLGCLACKPHLAVCVPLALLAGRRWRAMAGAACSGALLVAATVICLGLAPWRAFAAALPLSGVVLNSPAIVAKVLSTYAGVRILGGPGWLAVAAQAAAGGLAIVALLAACRRRC